MVHATPFYDVPYFRNQFRGDLIVTAGVLYYLPRTNVTAARYETKAGSGDYLGILSQLFGIAIGYQLIVDSIFALSSLVQRALRKKAKQTALRESGLWREGESSQELQQRLDAFIAETKREVTPLVLYEYSLPKPMRFARSEIRNLSVRRGRLCFQTEFDSHVFRIGFQRQKLLRDVLWEGGFVEGGAMPNKSLDASSGSKAVS